MGIRGLWQAIKNSSSTKPQKFDAIIVDGTMLVINFSMPIRHLSRDVFADVLQRTFNKRIHDLCTRLKSPDDVASLIFVFDPSEKPSKKIRPRQKLVGLPIYTFDIFEELMQAAGVTVVVAPDGHEADDEMAAICNDQRTDANANTIVYTEDSDLLCLVPAVMRFDFSIWLLDDILRDLNITKNIFLAACDMAANDYNDSTMTFARALSIVNKWSMDH